MTLVSPTLAQIGVVDVERSVVFYRNILGFDVRTYEYRDGWLVWAELCLGSASFRVARQSGVEDVPEQRQARRGIVLFFETDDVDAIRVRMIARGRNPGEIEELSFGKRMRICRTNDPDDYSLWFGEP